MRKFLAAVVAALSFAVGTPAAFAEAPPPDVYRFTDGFAAPPVYDQTSSPSCVGWAAATALSALSIVAGEPERFDGEAIYRPIAQPGGGAFLSDLVDELRTDGAYDSDGDVWKATSATWVDADDRDAVRRALVDGHVLIAAHELTQYIDERRKVRVHDDERVTGYHAGAVVGYGRHRVVVQESWGRDVVHHHGGKWRFSWRYFDRHFYQLVAITVAEGTTP